MIDLGEIENFTKEYWSKEDPIKKIKKESVDKKKYYFLDGPPYATGELGVHHVWVGVVKDVMLRYKRFRGFYVHDRAGFDVHGLPIENKVEHKLGLKTKEDIDSYGIDNFIEACKSFADEQVSGMIDIYRKYGSSLDFEDAYIPYKKNYMDAGWRMFKGIYDKGLVYSGKKALAYCPHCETVLSAQGPEIEYSDDTDPSIFVRFKVDPERSKDSRINIESNLYLVIWTTTPWTLPSNMAVAVNPEGLYVKAQFGDNIYIVAKDRLDAFAKSIDQSFTVLGEFYGSELQGIYYKGPFEDEIPKQREFAKFHRVLMEKGLVSMGDGTGLVHVAPGHGPEDFNVGFKNGIPIYSPVSDQAEYTDEAGGLKGIKIPDEANKFVLEKLKKDGSLLYRGSITHSYPHCWRCNSKLIYRSTDQWFIDIQKIKDKTIKANSKIKWHPKNTKEWQDDTLRNSPDWCISRQRYWGAPIPIWKCNGCDNTIAIGSAAELKEKAGLSKEPEDLHIPYIDNITFKCDKCEGTMHRVKDVFDVWWDSGIAHTASLSEEEWKRLFPSDWITESRDQLRGWFSMLIRTSVALYGKTPFKEVTIGGMVYDEHGMEMHRHLGNLILAKDLPKYVSADGYRLWCLGKPRWEDLKVKVSELKESDNIIVTYYNIMKLAREFSNLSGSDPKRVKKPNLALADKDDRWILSRINTIVKNSTELFDSYGIDQAINQMADFLVNDFSRTYLKIAKQKSEDMSTKKLRYLSNLINYVLYKFTVISSVALPFTSEYIYQKLFSIDGGSVFYEQWPKADIKYIDDNIEKEFDIAKELSSEILNLREKNSVRLRQPLSNAKVITRYNEVADAVAKLSNIIESLTNVKTISAEISDNLNLRIIPVFAKIGPEFKENSNVVSDALRKADPNELSEAVEKEGYYTLHTEKGNFTIKPEMYTISEDLIKENEEESKYGLIYLDTEITDDLKGELLVREIIRRIQMLRKEKGFSKSDRINVYLSADVALSALVKENIERIKKVTNSRSIDERLSDANGLEEVSFEISPGNSIKIAIEKNERGK